MYSSFYTKHPIKFFSEKVYYILGNDSVLLIYHYRGDTSTWPQHATPMLCKYEFLADVL